jgi:hypothetical protein
MVVHSVTRGWQDIGILLGGMGETQLPIRCLTEGCLVTSLMLSYRHFSKTYCRKSRGPRGWPRPAPHEGGPMASRSRRRRCGRTRGRGARGGAAARGRRWSRGGPRPVGPATPPAASGATGRCGRMGPRSDDGAARSARGRTACGRRSPWIRSTTICASRRRAYARHGRRPAVAATDARHGGGTDGARLDGARRAALPRATMATPSAGVRKRAQERARWMARSCHGGGCPHGQLGGGHEGCKGSWDARPTLS